MERRKFGVITRSFNSPQKMEGYASLFYEETELSNFCEMILPGAFRESIKKDDIRCLLNHSEDHILGRNRSGTLQLHEDSRGLKVAVTLPDTQDARDLAISVDRGDINQMSFAFRVQDEEWVKRLGQKDLRKLKKVSLSDVSVVTYPQYEGTSISLVRASRGRYSWPVDIITPFLGMAVNETRNFSDIDFLKRG